MEEVERYSARCDKYAPIQTQVLKDKPSGCFPIYNPAKIVIILPVGRFVYIDIDDSIAYKLPDGFHEYGRWLGFSQVQCSLIFGNEATGLDRKYAAVGKTIKIPQSNHIDSLNISVAVRIGTYVFASKCKLI